MNKSLHSLLILMLTYSAVVRAQEPVVVLKTTAPLVIDGRLDDTAWQGVTAYNGFKTYMPEFGADIAFATYVKITYDENNLFIGFDCRDPEPEKIKATITARDQIKGEDWVCVNFDPFFDHQGMVDLYVNPRGIQEDARGTANHEDVGADYVFYSAATIGAEGYQVEMQIPFKSLRFQHSDPVTMGFIFERKIQRLSQQATYPPLDPAKGMSFVTQTMAFSFKDIKRYTLLEFLPSVTYSLKQEHQGGKLGISENRPSVGFTGTVGLTSQLILDVAVNPDFSQVESDAGQITENQRYALYYPEKRPFFQEGKGNFDIAGTSEMSFFQQAFHTRQIENPLAGIKLTGKVSDQDRIGLLYALDNPLDRRMTDSTMNLVHFAIGRYQHAFRGDSYIGAIVTDREGTGIYNRIAGSDGRWRINPSTKLEFNLLGSSTVRKSGESAKGDWMGTVRASKNTNRLSANIQGQHIGTGFESQAGFLMRSGVSNVTADLSLNFYADSGFIQKISPFFYGFLNKDLRAGLWERDLGVGVSVDGKRSTELSLFLNPSDEVYLADRFRTHSIHAEFSSQVITSIRIEAEYRLGYRTRYVENPYTGWGNTASVEVNFQPWKKFQTDLSINYSDFFGLGGLGKEFSYLIIRSKNTFQINSKLFLRGIVEYNSYEKDLTTDLLASFTYIPGTVVHLGYGSLYQKMAWNGHEYQPGSSYLETIRGFFFKASYLFRN